MRKSSIILLVAGFCVTGFWVVAFGVCFGILIFGDHPTRQWWNIDFLKQSGLWLGHKVFNAYEDFGHVDYGYILGEGIKVFIALLAATATAIGAVVWLISQLCVSLYLSKRHKPSNNNP